MTDNELNVKVCEGLGWKTNKEWNPNTWDVPLDQPWFRDWDGETTAICPDFLNDPAESWRLMVWTKAQIDYCAGFVGWHWSAMINGFVQQDKESSSRALVLAFLASKGVEVKDV